MRWTTSLKACRRGDPRPGAGVQVCRQVLHQVLTGSDGLGRSGDLPGEDLRPVRPAAAARCAEVRPPKRPVVPLQSGLSEPMSADVERAKTTLLHRENSGQTSESWHRRSPSLYGRVAPVARVWPPVAGA